MTARRLLLALPFVVAAAVGAGAVVLAYVLDAIDQAEARSLEAVDG